MITSTVATELAAFCWVSSTLYSVKFEFQKPNQEKHNINRLLDTIACVVWSTRLCGLSSYTLSSLFLGLLFFMTGFWFAAFHRLVWFFILCYNNRLKLNPELNLIQPLEYTWNLKYRYINNLILPFFQAKCALRSLITKKMTTISKHITRHVTSRISKGELSFTLCCLPANTQSNIAISNSRRFDRHLCERKLEISMSFPPCELVAFLVRNSSGDSEEFMLCAEMQR